MLNLLDAEPITEGPIDWPNVLAQDNSQTFNTGDKQ